MVGKFTDPSLVQRAAEVASGLAARDEAVQSRSGDSVVSDEDVQASAQRIAKASTSQSSPERNMQLSEVLLLLEWTNPASSVAVQGQQDYLDGSCMVYSEERLLDVVDFRGAHSAVVDCSDRGPSSATLEWSAGKGKAASVLHSGDVMSTEGGTHVIRVCLTELPSFATDCFFVISAYNCRNLSLFRSLSMRLFDVRSLTDTPLSTFTTADAGNASAALVCALTRKLGVWSVRTFGSACDGTIRDYAPIETAIAPLQENHPRWRRRRPFVLLSLLWQARRAFLHDEMHDDDDDVVVPLLIKLHAHLFRYIMEFV
jgi:stress response protein SCP2